MKVISFPRCSIAYLRRTGAYGAENRAVMMAAYACQPGYLPGLSPPSFHRVDDPGAHPSHGLPL